MALKFTVRRKPAVMVVPAGPTPRELKRLSDIDDQDGLRFHIPVIYFFRRGGRRDGDDDPALVLRNAVAAALVHYYPFAGRLRELEGRKLAVDCTAEGVLFIEADADVGLDHFGEAPQPPFPGLEELIFDVPGSSALIDTPVLLFQVTRLACGGFVFGVRMQHTMADGAGLLQLLGAVAELARGATTPSVRPVWGREMLMDDPPLLSSLAHREYEEIEVPAAEKGITLDDDMVHRSFFFGPHEVAAIRSQLDPDLRETATTFEVLAGCLWKCRTMALSPAPSAHDEMRMICVVNLRGKSPAEIPSGYYGNAVAYLAAISKAGDLCTNPVGYAVQLVKKVKRAVDMEYMRSVANLMVRRRRPHYTVVNAYLLSDLSKVRFSDIDFGWGTPLYAGPAKGAVGIVSFIIPFNKGELNGLLVPVCLPGQVAMDKFVEQVERLTSTAAARALRVSSKL